MLAEEIPTVNRDRLQISLDNFQKIPMPRNLPPPKGPLVNEINDNTAREREAKSRRHLSPEAQASIARLKRYVPRGQDALETPAVLLTTPKEAPSESGNITRLDSARARLAQLKGQASSQTEATTEAEITKEEKEVIRKQVIWEEVVTYAKEQPEVIAEIIKPWLDRGPFPLSLSPTAAERQLANMTGLQKTAALMIVLGPDAAPGVLKQLRDDDVERVTLEISRMREVPAAMTNLLVNRLYENIKSQDFKTGGIELANEVLTRVMGPQKAAEPIARLERRIDPKPFDFLAEVDSPHLVSVIQGEHPQTVALILSHLAQNYPEQAALVLTSLSPETQADVTMRIARMDRTAPEAVKEVERLLKKKTSAFPAQKQTVDGLKVVVETLKHADKSSAKAIMDQLDKTYPELADEIKKNMFTFEDLKSLDSTTLEKIFRVLETPMMLEPDFNTLALALKGAPDDLSEHILKAAGINAKTIFDRLEELGPQRLESVKEARDIITALVRRLEQAGNITLPRPGEAWVDDTPPPPPVAAVTPTPDATPSTPIVDTAIPASPWLRVLNAIRRRGTTPPPATGDTGTRPPVTAADAGLVSAEPLATPPPPDIPKLTPDFVKAHVADVVKDTGEDPALVTQRLVDLRTATLQRENPRLSENEAKEMAFNELNGRPS